MKTLSETFDALKEEVENLKKPNPDKENSFTATWIPRAMSQVMTHLQTLLGLVTDRLRETDKSGRRKDTLGAELAMTTGAEALGVGILHIFGHGQIGRTKIPTRFLIIVKTPFCQFSGGRDIRF